MEEISLKGNIKDTCVPKILYYLKRNRKTGTLVFKTPVFVKKVFIVKGEAIFASSTYEDDRLGEMLIKAGKITLEQYEKSVELLKKTGKRQGAILVELGFLSPKDLFWGVKYQVREIIYSLFLLEDAEYEFIEGEIPSNEVITLRMSMGNLIYEGVKRIDNWTRIKNELPDINTVLKLSTDPANLFQDIELTHLDRRMLSLIDGKRTIKELLNSSWISSFDAFKIIYVLLATGIVEEKKTMEPVLPTKEEVFVDEIFKPITEEEEAFIKRVDDIYNDLYNKGFYELLEVDENADLETITKNYYRLSKEFHPDRYFNSSDLVLRDKLSAIFDAITHAYNSLKKSFEDKGRKNVDLGVETDIEEINPEELFYNGIRKFKEGNFLDAIKFFKLCTDISPDTAKYWSYLSLAFTKIPQGFKDAEEALRRAISLEPGNVDYIANLGLIYLGLGQKELALEQFKKALSIDPDNLKAKKGLEKVS